MTPCHKKTHTPHSHGGNLGLGTNLVNPEIKDWLTSVRRDEGGDRLSKAVRLDPPSVSLEGHCAEGNASPEPDKQEEILPNLRWHSGHPVATDPVTNGRERDDRDRDNHA